MPNGPPPRIGRAAMLQRFAEGSPVVIQKNPRFQALRIVGPFTVAMPEGDLDIEDGWLCEDLAGFPFGLTADEVQVEFEVVRPPPP